MKRCFTCQSCLKFYTLESKTYQVCFLCYRMWKINGQVLIEVFDGELDEYGNNIKQRFKDLVKGLPI